jgi:hypothetical protein
MDVDDDDVDFDDRQIQAVAAAHFVHYQRAVLAPLTPLTAADTGIDTTCCICIEPGATHKTRRCNHPYHAACFMEWNSTCALCRAPLETIRMAPVGEAGGPAMSLREKDAFRHRWVAAFVEKLAETMATRAIPADATGTATTMCNNLADQMKLDAQVVIISCPALALRAMLLYAFIESSAEVFGHAHTFVSTETLGTFGFAPTRRRRDGRLGAVEYLPRGADPMSFTEDTRVFVTDSVMNVLLLAGQEWHPRVFVVTSAVKELETCRMLLGSRYVMSLGAETDV